MREKGKTEAAKTLETPVFSRGIEILTEKVKFIEQITRAHFYAPFGVVHYARNLALPLGEPRGPLQLCRMS